MFSSRFEAEISNVNMFVPSQVRPIIGSNTYNQVQQKLNEAPVPQPTHPPQQPYIPQYIPPQVELPEKSYNTEPTPVVLSSAPKLYGNRPSVGAQIELPQFDTSNVSRYTQFPWLL